MPLTCHHRHLDYIHQKWHSHHWNGSSNTGVHARYSSEDDLQSRTSSAVWKWLKGLPSFFASCSARACWTLASLPADKGCSSLGRCHIMNLFAPREDDQHLPHHLTLRRLLQAVHSQPAAVPEQRQDSMQQG